MSRLLTQRKAFCRMVPRLLDKAADLGFDYTINDVLRDKRCPYGSKSSRHRLGLAIDINLYQGDTYLTTTEDHAQLGAWWVAQGGIWGGDWDDGNHYEWPL